MANGERAVPDKPAPAQAPAEGGDEKRPREDPGKPEPGDGGLDNVPSSWPRISPA